MPPKTVFITAWKIDSNHHEKSKYDYTMSPSIPGLENDIFRYHQINPPPNTIKSRAKTPKMKLLIKPDIRTETVRSGEEYKVFCVSKGSRPPASVSWWTNDHMFNENMFDQVRNILQVKIPNWK